MTTLVYFSVICTQWTLSSCSILPTNLLSPPNQSSTQHSSSSSCQHRKVIAITRGSRHIFDFKHRNREIPTSISPTPKLTLTANQPLPTTKTNTEGPIHYRILVKNPRGSAGEGVSVKRFYALPIYVRVRLRFGSRPYAIRKQITVPSSASPTSFGCIGIHLFPFRRG